MTPRISFVMPAWKSRFIRQAILSILRQTCPEWELIVVDDCSPEPLEEIVNTFKDSRIRYIRNDENLGGKDLVRQWNHCITFAKGDFIVLASDDDIYKETFCGECVRLIDKYPSVNLVRSSVETIDEDGKHLYSDYIPSEFISKQEYLYLWLTGQLSTCIGNFAFRRTALMEAGGFISFPCAFGTDVATPIALSNNGVANLPQMLFCFRVSSQHLSADKSRYVEKLEAISQLSEWLQAIDNEGRTTTEFKEYESVMNADYLHRKVVYEYYNLVIKFLPLRKLYYLRYCRLATPVDKVMMLLRWMKKNIFGKVVK